MGFLCILIPNLIILAVTGSLFSGNIPQWICFVHGIFHLIYMNFDNMDGKQARKTGSASPLGLLFDHQCDSLVIMLQCISLCTVCQVGQTVYILICYYLVGVFPFYLATLEEFYIFK